MIAADLAESIEAKDEISKVMPLGGYVNFFVNVSNVWLFVFAFPCANSICVLYSKFTISNGVSISICLDKSIVISHKLEGLESVYFQWK